VCQGASFFDDVRATGPDPSMVPLIDQVMDLWKTCFGDFGKADGAPDLQALVEDKGWKVVVFATEKSDSDPDRDLNAEPFKVLFQTEASPRDAGADTDRNAQDSKRQLLGFLAYNTLPGIDELHILRLAVPKVYRRQGYGTQLIRWACSKTSSVGLKSVWLYATPDVEDFYERVGFLNMGYMCDPSLCPEEDDSERYSWMMLDVEQQ
jgi:ribosomal protein S18 acetylase RimI-like enzyme